jgi:DNA-binding GntR family transcriptional regulator
LSKKVYQPNPEWEALHRAFHRGLLSQCTSSWLLSFCDSLADEAYRFRQLAAGRVFSSRNEHAEHLALFEAAIHGKVDEALQLLHQHFTKTNDVVQAQAHELGHTT